MIILNYALYIVYIIDYNYEYYDMYISLHWTGIKLSFVQHKLTQTQNTNINDMHISYGNYIHMVTAMRVISLLISLLSVMICASYRYVLFVKKEKPLALYCTLALPVILYIAKPTTNQLFCFGKYTFWNY